MQRLLTHRQEGGIGGDLLYGLGFSLDQGIEREAEFGWMNVERISRDTCQLKMCSSAQQGVCGTAEASSVLFCFIQPLSTYPSSRLSQALQDVI